MKKELLITLLVYILFPVSGSLYGIGEKTISLGGGAAWNLAANRAGISEAARVRPYPVLVLTSAGNSGAGSGSGTAAALDLSLGFDEGAAGHFKDGAGHYRLSASPALEAADRRWARAGTGAALFPGTAPDGTGSPNGALVIEAQSRQALFAPDSHIRDFTLEFWLYPLNLENGEQILSWISSRPLQPGRAGNAGGGTGAGAGGISGKDYAFQRIQCGAAKNRLQWSFLDFFVSPDGSKYIDINFAGDSPVVPKAWSHHLIRFDSGTGMVEYLVNGRSEAIVYASSTGREGGEVYTPIAGTGGSFTLGGRYTGLMDEFKIHRAWLARPSTQKYPLRGGRMETAALDLGEGNSGIVRVDASGGRTSVSGARFAGEFRQNGRFRFADDSELQFFIRTADNPYQWEDSSWRSFTPGTDIAGNIRGRYAQIAVDFYPSADGETSPYLEELRISYIPDEPPLPPQALTAAALDGAVQLRWKNSSDPDTAGYLIYYGTRQDDYFGEDAALGASPIDAGKRTGLLVDGLKNGTLYYFRVAAYDRRDSGSPTAFHAGEFSREVRARPLEGLSFDSLRMAE